MLLFDFILYILNKYILNTNYDFTIHVNKYLGKPSKTKQNTANHFTFEIE